jgi:hypothetical protein
MLYSGEKREKKSKILSKNVGNPFQKCRKFFLKKSGNLACTEIGQAIGKKSK